MADTRDTSDTPHARRRPRWSRLSRRRFLAGVIAAAGAAMLVDLAPPPRPWASRERRTRWIGHG